jgi:hypothetical protein
MRYGDKVKVNYEAYKSTELEVDSDYGTQYSELEFCLDDDDQKFLEYLMKNTTFTVSVVDTMKMGRFSKPRLMVSLKELEELGIDLLFYVEELIPVKDQEFIQ